MWRKLDPATYIEVVASVDRKKWISTMQEEMQSFQKKPYKMLCPNLNKSS
jgi:hypothetical protein